MDKITMSETAPILVVGTGNAEYIIKLDCKFECNNKYLADYYEFVGGSGVNYTLRLAAAGFEVLPILPIGQDATGERIKTLISNQTQKNSSGFAADYINSDQFFMKDIKTIVSTLIIDKNRTRTGFSEQNTDNINFKDHLSTNLYFIKDQLNCPIKTVLIGHIHSDNSKVNPLNPGETSKYLIEWFKKKSLIFANFGHSQISLGVKHWETYLAKIDVFQLNLSEMKLFFFAGGYDYSLIEIVEWFLKNKVTTVITLDELGAIGIYNKKTPKIIWAAGNILDNFVDSTGAGDAFMSGLVSRLHGKPNFGFDDFVQAIQEGQTWAEYSCSSFGAASDCPTLKQIEEFKDGTGKLNEPIKILSFKDAKPILRKFF